MSNNDKKNKSHLTGKDAIKDLESISNEQIKEGEAFDRLYLIVHLKQRMSEHNTTQMELSEKSGVRQATISQMSRGNVERLHVPSLEKIARALDITDIRELITFELESEIMNAANPFDVEF